MTRLLLISNSTLHGSGYLDHCAEAIASFLGPSVTRGPVRAVRALRSRRVRREGARALRSDGVRSRLRPRFARRAGSRRRAAPRRCSSAAATRSGCWTRCGATSSSSRSAAACARACRTSARAPARTSRVRRFARRTTCRSSSRRRSRRSISCRSTSTRTIWIRSPARRTWGRPASSGLPSSTRRTRRRWSGLREGAWLLVEGPSVVLQGANGARLFRRGEAPTELVSGVTLDFVGSWAPRRLAATRTRRRSQRRERRARAEIAERFDAAPRSGDDRPRGSECEPAGSGLVRILILSASHPGLLRRPAASKPLRSQRSLR